MTAWYLSISRINNGCRFVTAETGRRVCVLAPQRLKELFNKALTMANVSGYIKECYVELKDKVSWPAWDELQSSVIVVMIASLICSVILLSASLAA